MAEYFFDLSKEDQREALEYGRAETGRPAHLLEKDVWVVWTLRTLFESPLAADLTLVVDAQQRRWRLPKRGMEEVCLCCTS